MKDLKWTDKFSMGSSVIDEHHQKLIGYINDLDSAINDGPVSPLYLASLVKKLEDYTVYHFQVEEGYMKHYNYPEYEAHKEEHEAFISYVHKLKESVASHSLNSALHLASYLKSWLIQHILVIDKEYAIYFQQQGIHVE